MKRLLLLSCLALAGCDDMEYNRKANAMEAKGWYIRESLEVERLLDSAYKPCCTVRVADTVWARKLWGEGGQVMSKEQFDSTVKAVPR